MNHKSNSNTSAGFMDPVLDLRAERAAAAKECVEFSNWNNNRNKPGKKVENMKTHTLQYIQYCRRSMLGC